MPRLLLEGKSLTELLARVRDEHGPDVTIVAADKVRTGGIGGFFARETYALTVEVDDPAHPAADGFRPERALAAQQPGTLLDLAAAIDAAEAAEQSVILATAPMHTRPPEPVLSTASPEFRSILARLTALDAPQPETEPSSAPAAAPEVVPAADAYTRLREVLAEIAPHLDLGSGVPVVLVLPPAAPASDVPAPVAPAIPRQGRHRRAADAVS